MILLYLLYEYFGGEAVSSSPPPVGLCLCKSERKRVKTLLVIGEEKRLRIVQYDRVEKKDMLCTINTCTRLFTIIFLLSYVLSKLAIHGEWAQNPDGPIQPPPSNTSPPRYCSLANFPSTSRFSLIPGPKLAYQSA